MFVFFFFLDLKEEVCVGKCHFLNSVYTYRTIQCVLEKKITMHRSLNMNIHGSDMYMTEVLILPSEVPRSANMITKSSMCHIFTSLLVH